MNFFDFYSEPEDFGVRRQARRGEIRDVLRDFCRFPLPCFATGCHTFGLKIATAALRPRNDTKSGRFYLENKCFMRLFFCTVAPHRFSNASFRKLFRFPAKPTRLVIARRAHFSARRGNLKVEGMGSRNEVCKHETRQGKKQNVLVPNVEHIPFCSVFPCFVPGCRFVPSKIAASLCSSQ